MHDDEVDIDEELVRALLASQFPQWRGLPITPVPSVGTVNAIYRLGDDLCVRLPRTARFAPDLPRELAWLPRLAPYLGVEIPEPVAAGTPNGEYPFTWAVLRWIDGATFDRDDTDDEVQVARDLASFVRELRDVDTSGAVSSTRDRPLRARDHEIQAALDAMRGFAEIDVSVDALAVAWERALTAPEWNAEAVWTHGDLLPSNVLVAGGRLAAVIDWGCVGAGDPAVDVVPAWSFFGAEARAVYQSALSVDDATWERARGIALHQALMIIPYYRFTNPGFVAMALQTIEQVTGDR